MDKELIIIDKLTDIKKNKIEINDFSSINWDKFLLYLLKTKTICIVFNSLQYSALLKHIPTNIYKLMSEIYIGNLEHNRNLKHELELITQLFNENGICIYEFKNLSNRLSTFENLLMPNDIDFIASHKDKNYIHQLLIDSHYKIKRINNEINTSYSFSSVKSILYEQTQINRFGYPIKIDINYSYDCFDQMNEIIKDYTNSSSTYQKDCLLFIISVIDFYSHINGNANNIKINDFLKIKRLNIQYHVLNISSSYYIKKIINKFKVYDVFYYVENVIINYKSLF